ncbi:AAA family ATPase [Nocardioides sp.]|uniref:ATP-binding protein n=1 Tax=metagenome TaxID=256318 RepID=A0A2P2BXA1_9ZZZZ
MSNQVGRLHVLIGLPGSGKSTFLRERFQVSHPEVAIFDDYQAHAIADQSDPQWSRNRPSAIETLRGGTPVLVSDISYCRASAIDRLVSLMRQDVPGVEIDLIYFANDPEAAAHNVRLRGRDQCEREIQLIREFSADYRPPASAMPGSAQSLEHR